MDHKEVLYAIYIIILKLFTAKQRFQKIKVVFWFLNMNLLYHGNQSFQFLWFYFISCYNCWSDIWLLLKQRYAINSLFIEKEMEKKEEETTSLLLDQEQTLKTQKSGNTFIILWKITVKVIILLLKRFQNAESQSLHRGWWRL